MNAEPPCIFWPQAALAILLWCWASLASPAWAIANTCPSATELRVELEQRNQKLAALKAGLESFMAGNSAQDFPLNVLFMIDLSDSTVVAKRVEALKQEIALLKTGHDSDPAITCALTDPSLGAIAQNVIQLDLAVSELRLQFLGLETDKRQAILKPLLEASVQAAAAKELKEKRDKALEAQKEAVKSLAQAEQKELSVNHMSNVGLVSAQTELERVKADLVVIQLRWLSDSEKEVSGYQAVLEQLAQVGKVLIVKDDKPSDPKASYENLVKVWRELVDKTLNVVISKRNLDLPNLPDYPQDLLSQDGESVEAKKYAETYREIQDLRDSLRSKAVLRSQETIDLHYRVLLQSGDLRSQLLNQLLDSNDSSPLAFSADLFKDVHREFSMVPYRLTALFMTKMLDVERRFHQGWQGMVEGAVNLTLFIGFLLIPWGMWWLSKQLSVRLNSLREQLVRKSRQNPMARNFALVIQKLLPYTSWLTMLLAIFLAQWLLQKSIFSELVLLLPYLRYYVYYRLFRQVMQFDYVWINQQIKAAKLWDLRKQVDVIVRTIGLGVFLVFCLLKLIESLARRGLIYHFITSAFYYLAIVFLMILAFQWRSIVAASLERQIPGLLGRQLANLTKSAWGFVLAVPALAVILVALLIKLLALWGEHFELTRKVAAQLFRYRLETTIDNRRGGQIVLPPTDYQDHYNLSGANKNAQIIKPGNGIYDEVLGLIEDWAQNKSAINSLVVTGYKGIGKTCLSQFLAGKITRASIFSRAIDHKCTTDTEVLGFVADLVQTKSNDSETLLQDLSNRQGKTLLLIDDTHNLFLAKEGGFDGFRTLLDLIGRAPNTVFWCLNFNQHGWTYLNSVVNRQPYVDAVIKLTGWTEQAIQEMILNIHNTTGYKLSYDDILLAVGGEIDSHDVVYVENRFFSLLWQQSRGNPRLAIYLWLSALRLVGNKELRVGLPQEPETLALSQLPDAAIFVLASLARHENLRLEEILAVTQLPEGVVRQVLDNGVRSNLLMRDPHQVYRLAIIFQYPLINYLKAKHCLYE